MRALSQLGAEKITFHTTDIRTDISIYRVASLLKTRMTTLVVKSELENLDDQKKIDKYRMSCKYYRISYYIKINLTTKNERPPHEKVLKLRENK